MMDSYLLIQPKLYTDNLPYLVMAYAFSSHSAVFKTLILFNLLLIMQDKQLPMQPFSNVGLQQNVSEDILSPETTDASVVLCYITEARTPTSSCGRSLK